MLAGFFLKKRIMKPLQLFNALNERKEPFLPLNTQDVKIYCCGPIVYDAPNLEQARTYVFMDVLRRILHHHLGYGVRLVMNLTDLHDKITSTRVARYHERVFFRTMDLLNVERPDFTPRATDCIELARNVSRRCLLEEFAYYKPGFDITYFSTEAYFKKHGHVFPDKKGKEEEEGKWNPRDFALWKASKCWFDGEGKKRNGMPGLEAECTAVTTFYFPESVDIHLGHHENEIALSHVYSDKKERIRFCLHTGGVQTEEEVTVDELLDEKYSPLAIRYMFLKQPYDKPINFNKADLKEAQIAYDDFIARINQMKLFLLELKTKETEVEEKWYDQYGAWGDVIDLNEVKETIHDFLLDNVNTSKALEKLEDYVQRFSSESMNAMSYEWLRYCLTYILRMTDTCFGLI